MNYYQITSGIDSDSSEDDPSWLVTTGVAAIRRPRGGNAGENNNHGTSRGQNSRNEQNGNLSLDGDRTGQNSGFVDQNDFQLDSFPSINFS